MIKIGVKTDPVNTRYSFNWLFDLLNEEDIKFVQLGSFFELYSVEDAYFLKLKEEADKRKIIIKSMFTAHRELGGFFYGDKFMERAARKNYERLIEVASILKTDYCGSNPGSVHRDKMQLKNAGISCYLFHIKELMHIAKEKGLKALTIEPMSCLAEPPTLFSEIKYMMDFLDEYHQDYKDTVPVYLCSDITHGYINSDYKVIESNKELFRHSIPYMAEFHFKNTDENYNSTFGFSAEEQQKGIIDLNKLCEMCDKEKSNFPVDEVVGYLEINGPKTGRDYSDLLLKDQLTSSLKSIKDAFNYKHINQPQ